MPVTVIETWENDSPSKDATVKVVFSRFALSHPERLKQDDSPLILHHFSEIE
ncbi:uncharacterized protein PADG_01493 [Paracoccidioides brasiliensis Pb18]|uniref:Uncharacterized protein n=1 Tax=Paracoccidioides brasiliensis (strain Pb18) TaxID=502780 RepID=C1G3H7_PARBD|nr:uncharacterized protein PADG_01493 [Paracoccidioides brasiliensis Pb18]EEH45343.1 hypothetical protein PADG_01493 [Paracoccidioides brasiliensis Pb18]